MPNKLFELIGSCGLAWEGDGGVKTNLCRGQNRGKIDKNYSISSLKSTISGHRWNIGLILLLLSCVVSLLSNEKVSTNKAFKKIEYN